MTNPIYDPSTELVDLGAARFDHEVAAITDKDAALLCATHTGPTRKIKPPKALERTVFAWSTLQYEDSERNEKEEGKEDLHGGLLHRQNRAARGEGGDGGGGARGMGMGMGVSGAHFGGGGGAGRGVGRGGRKGRAGRERVVEEEVGSVRVAAKPEGCGEVRPEAKGFAKELDASMFWDEPIV